MSKYVQSLFLACFAAVIAAPSFAQPSSDMAMKKPTVAMTTVNFVKLKAATGNPKYQHMLGQLYEDGNGVPQDNALALKWYHKAAGQGNARAQTRLGVIYMYGTIAPQDIDQSILWTQRAADQGDFGAQYNLGVMYYLGLGVAENPAQAAVWFEKAVAQHEKSTLAASAQWYLGSLYVEGKGVDKQVAKGMELIQDAASAGNPEAKAYIAASGNF